MHLVHQHIFRLQPPPYFISLKVDWTRLICCCPPHSPDLKAFDFFQLKLLVYETPVTTVKSLLTWVVFVSADIASTRDLFEHARQSFICLCQLRYNLHGLNFGQFL
ncbi:hypothetical protein TNCV_548151 [Trichonephila clavipes]|nr:hypothetical protein TNCV_548151 [Trichonephila clavipes]